MTEGRLVNNCVKLENPEIYKLIHEAVFDPKCKGTVSLCCSILGVHGSGDYNYLKQQPYYVQKIQEELKAKELILEAMNHRGYKKGSRSIKMVLLHDFIRRMFNICRSSKGSE